MEESTIVDESVTALNVTAAHAEQGIMALILQADIVVQLVLIILVLMSVVCWGIIISKYKMIRQAERSSQAFLDMFWGSPDLDRVYKDVDAHLASPIANVFRAGYIELSKLTNSERGQTVGGAVALSGEDNLHRALRKAATVQRTNLERMSTFLATTGSTAPFIGLFGTVWGILRAFQKIGLTGQATMQTVGPDIAHALIATAIGLAAAIPAVMAYNFFNRRTRVLTTEMDNFSDDFLNIVKRHFHTA